MNALPLLMIAVLAGGFWFLVMRPAKARQQAQLKVVNELSVGDRVMTTAGLFGTIRDITDSDVGLEIADGVIVRYVREAIAKTIVTPSSAEEFGEIELPSGADALGSASDTASKK
ncbi:MAG: preprotein translocase subunit YajC [Actinobacteria bacterium]|nr:preprotein translocase subunit YajC [Actinomycetota bacterium]